MPLWCKKRFQFHPLKNEIFICFQISFDYVWKKKPFRNKVVKDMLWYNVHLRTHWKSDWIDVILVWQAIWFNLSSSIELALSGVHESSDPISAPKVDLESLGDLEFMGDPTTSAPMSGVSFVFEADFGSTHDLVSMSDLWSLVFQEDLGSTHNLVSMSDLWSLVFREDFGPIHDPGPSSKSVTIAKLSCSQ